MITWLKKAHILFLNIQNKSQVKSIYIKLYNLIAKRKCEEFNP